MLQLNNKNKKIHENSIHLKHYYELSAACYYQKVLLVQGLELAK